MLRSVFPSLVVSPLLKTVPNDYLSAKHEDDVEEHDLLDSSLTDMDWLPWLNAKAGVVEEEV